MEDRKEIIAVRRGTVTESQLAADIQQLRTLWTDLQQTEMVVLRGMAACKESRALLRRLETETLPFG